MDLQDYLKSINPQKDSQAILVYGSTYRLWRDGQYLGEATWTQDENVGDSFQVYGEKDQRGFYEVEVYIADQWELLYKNLSSPSVAGK